MSAILSRLRLEEIIAAVRVQRVGVIGDFTLDGYWHADMERSELSRETPLYPRPVVQETYSPGGAANVAWNLADLGVCDVQAFSVLGEDWRGHLLRGLLAAEGIRTDGILNQPDRVTPFYGKVVLRAAGRCAQEDARLDFINTNPVSAEREGLVLDRLAQALPQLGALIVADYQDQGVITPRVTAGLLDLANDYPKIPIVVDSRSRAAAFRSLMMKPNKIEAERLLFPGREPGTTGLEALAQAAIKYQAGSDKPIFITLGPEGCLVCFDGRCERAPGVPVAQPVDTVGAGDTFISALAAALAARAAPLEAACFANLAASITVKKLGVTGTASPAELFEQYDWWVEAER